MWCDDVICEWSLGNKRWKRNLSQKTNSYNYVNGCTCFDPRFSRSSSADLVSSSYQRPSSCFSCLASPEFSCGCSSCSAPYYPGPSRSDGPSSSPCCHHVAYSPKRRFSYGYSLYFDPRHHLPLNHAGGFCPYSFFYRSDTHLLDNCHQRRCLSCSFSHARIEYLACASEHRTSLSCQGCCLYVGTLHRRLSLATIWMFLGVFARIIVSTIPTTVFTLFLWPPLRPLLRFLRTALPPRRLRASLLVLLKSSIFRGNMCLLSSSSSSLSLDDESLSLLLVLESEDEDNDDDELSSSSLLRSTHWLLSLFSRGRDFLSALFSRLSLHR